MILTRVFIIIKHSSELRIHNYFFKIELILGCIHQLFGAHGLQTDQRVHPRAQAPTRCPRSRRSKRNEST